MKNDKYLFFYGKSSPFSQWFPSTFYYKNIKYVCCEQFMMYQKAILFRDKKSARDILKTKNPRYMKIIGRNIKGFTESKWEQKKRKIVFLGNYLKFSQNHALKLKLLSTKEKTLVEASPWDLVWGIGRNIHDPNISNSSYWRGKNLLGYILVDVRNKLQENK